MKLYFHVCQPLAVGKLDFHGDAAKDATDTEM